MAPPSTNGRFSNQKFLVCFQLSGVSCERSSKKPVRAAAIDADPQPTPAATRVPVHQYDPAPYSTLFRPENLDLTGFFGPQFVNTKHLAAGVDVKSLYAQFGSPHQHFAFTFPPGNKAANRLPGLQYFQQPPAQKQRVQQQQPHQVQVPIPVQSAAPHKQQASEEFSQYYAQATPADFAPHPQPQPQQQVYAHQQQPQLQFVAHPPSAYARPQHYPQAQVEARPQQHSPQAVQYQPQYAPAYPSQAPAHPPQQPQSDAYQSAIAAAQKPTKVDLNAVIQTQVLPQLKDAQGIQLLDLSEFYPQQKGATPTYYQVHPSDDFKTASFTQVDLNSFYPQQQQQQQQNSKVIPAAAIREPTLSVEELSALLQKQNGGFQPILNPAGPSQQPPTHQVHPQQQHHHPASYAYVQSAQPAGASPHHHHPHHRQQLQQINLNAYYAQV